LVAFDHSIEWRQGITSRLRQLCYRIPTSEDTSSEHFLGSTLESPRQLSRGRERISCRQALVAHRRPEWRGENDYQFRAYTFELTPP
jgi:hypothetical protein